MRRRVQKHIFGLLMFGFGILVSLWPFHTWAPLGYGAAPSSAAMLHAGVLKKFGLYGLIQIALPLLPAGGTAAVVIPLPWLPGIHTTWIGLLAWLALGNVLVIGLVTMAQRDLKQMVGYSSVMHMGYAFLGIACLSVLGAGGVVMLMVAHGLSVALLFLLATSIHHRTQTFDLAEMGGLAQQAPVLAAFFTAATLASIGLPGFANFWGELTIFVALWKFSPWMTAAAVAGIVISAVYGLRAAARVFFGPPTPGVRAGRRRAAAGRPAVERAPAGPHPARRCCCSSASGRARSPTPLNQALQTALPPLRTAPAQVVAAGNPPMPVAAIDLFRSQDIAASNQWLAILPELLPGRARAPAARARAGAAEGPPGGSFRRSPSAASWSCSSACWLDFHTAFLDQDTFARLLHHSEGGQFMRVFFVLTAMLVCLLATVTLERQPVPRASSTTS